MIPLRESVTPSVLVFTTMPSAAGTVHDAWFPGGPPSISTMHMRHAPKAFIPG